MNNHLVCCVLTCVSPHPRGNAAKTQYLVNERVHVRQLESLSVPVDNKFARQLIIIYLQNKKYKSNYVGLESRPKVSAISFRTRSWTSGNVAKHRNIHRKVVIVVSPPAMNRSETSHSNWCSFGSRYLI